MYQDAIDESFARYIARPVSQTLIYIILTGTFFLLLDITGLALGGSLTGSSLFLLVCSAAAIWVIVFLFESAMYLAAVVVESWGYSLYRLFPYATSLGILFLLIVLPVLDLFSAVRFGTPSEFPVVRLITGGSLAAVLTVLVLAFLVRVPRKLQALQIVPAAFLYLLFDGARRISWAPEVDVAADTQIFIIWIWLLVTALLAVLSYHGRDELYRNEAPVRRKAAGLVGSFIVFLASLLLFLHYAPQIGAYEFGSGLQVMLLFTLYFATSGFAIRAMVYLGLPWLFPRSRPLLTAAGLLALVLVLASLGFRATGSVQTAVAVQEQTFITGPTAIRLGKIADGDGDGAAAVLLGIDCDDNAAAVYPGAYDIPGNGIDEDCSGEDAQTSPPENMRARLREVRQAVKKFKPKKDKTARLIVLITVDGLRTKSLSTYGYGRPTSENLTGFAKQATLFENAISPSSSTRLALGSIMYGRYPSNMNWRKVLYVGGTLYDTAYISPTQMKVFQNMPLGFLTVPAARNPKSLAERLQEAGYQTILIGSDGYAGFLKSEFGYHRGYDFAFEPNKDGNKDHNADFLAKVLKKQLAMLNPKKPVFVHLHYADLRSPYRDRLDPVSFGGSAQDRYESSIAWWDVRFGRLWENIQKSPSYKRSMIIVMGSNGQAFGEHGTYYQGRDLYQETVHVPLLIRFPQSGPRPRVKVTVSTLDVFPTILAAAAAPAAGNDGVTLQAAASGFENAYTLRPAFSQVFQLNSPGGAYTIRLQAAFDGPWKIIADGRTGLYSLYNLAKDPHEQKQLGQKKKARLEALKNTLKGLSPNQTYSF